MSFELGREIMRDALVSGSQGKISREAVENFGTTSYAVALGGGFLLAEMEFRSRARFNRLFTPTSSGVDLEKLGNDNHDVPVVGASAAVVSLELERTVTTSEVTVPALTLVTSQTGIKFTTDEDVVFTIGQAGPKTVTATSVLFGSDQNAEPSTITAFEGASPQSDMTITNPERAAGGNDRESDAEYRARIAARYTTASKGIAAAIEREALKVPQVRTATVYEILGSDGKPLGGGELYVADKLGFSNQAMIDAVLARMPDARALGAWVDAFGATPQEEQIRVAITWATGKATPLNRRLAQQSIAALTNTRVPRAQVEADLVPDAAKLTPGLIETAARQILGVEGVDVLLPVGEVIPAKGAVLRTRVSLVDVV